MTTETDQHTQPKNRRHLAIIGVLAFVMLFVVTAFGVKILVVDPFTNGIEERRCASTAVVSFFIDNNQCGKNTGTSLGVALVKYPVPETNEAIYTGTVIEPAPYHDWTGWHNDGTIENKVTLRTRNGIVIEATFNRFGYDYSIPLDETFELRPADGC